jgi:hypothetical protein
MFDQIFKPRNHLYARVAAGLLEMEYAGFDGEVATPLRQGRFLVGLQGSIVTKRDVSNPLKLRKGAGKSYYDVEFVNTRVNLPEVDLSVDLKTGRFLGGDLGARVAVTKHVKRVDLSAWYTVTDTSVFRDKYNRGYQDLGIAVTIPMRLFEGTDSRTSYGLALSPWNRDVGQDLFRYRDLFGFIGRDTKIHLERDKAMLR